MEVIVPFAAQRPKTRLRDVLAPEERRSFAEAMLADVLIALRGTDFDPHVLATEPLDLEVGTTVDDRRLTTAVNAALAAAEPSPEAPVGVVMADLGLATPDALSLLDPDGKADLLLTPGRGGGTNALVTKHPGFRVDYHGASYLDHLQSARALGATVREVDSYRLSTDIDERQDLVELLLHSDGAARDWLVDAGFDLDIDEGRLGVVREG